MSLRTGSVLQPASPWMVSFTSSSDGASFRNKYTAGDLITGRRRGVAKAVGNARASTARGQSL